MGPAGVARFPTTPQPIPASRSYRRENSLPSPSNVSSSPASNPWLEDTGALIAGIIVSVVIFFRLHRKTPESAAPTPSMRALIAEAEAQDKHSRQQPVMKVVDDRYDRCVIRTVMASWDLAP